MCPSFWSWFDFLIRGWAGSASNATTCFGTLFNQVRRADQRDSEVKLKEESTLACLVRTIYSSIG
jgi:hypothetical protein